MARVKRDVIVGRADPVDIHQVQHVDAPFRADRNAGEMLAPGRERFEECDDPVVHSRPFSFVEAQSRSGHRGHQPFRFDRLQQVVEGVHLERTQGILVVGGHEDDDRDLLRRHGLQQRQTVELRHLHVEEDDVRGELANHVERGRPVAALAGNDHLGQRPQEPAEPPPRHRFVVHDQHAHDHVSTSNGTTIRIDAPSRRSAGDVEGVGVAVDGGQAFARVAQADPVADGRRIDSGSVIFDLHDQAVRFATGANDDAAGEPVRPDAVLDRVLDEWLEDEDRHQRVRDVLGAARCRALRRSPKRLR